VHVAIGRLKDPAGNPAINIKDYCPGGREWEVQAGDCCFACCHATEDCT